MYYKWRLICLIGNYYKGNLEWLLKRTISPTTHGNRSYGNTPDATGILRESPGWALSRNSRGVWNMKVEYFPEMHELSLWEAWNDTVHWGELPLEDKDGRQYLKIGGNLIMSVLRNESIAGGWDVKLEDEITIRGRFAKDGDEFNLNLKKAKKIYKLE